MLLEVFWMFCERKVSLKGLLLLFLHKDWEKILSLSLSLSLCVRLCCWLFSKRRKRSIVAMALSIKVRVSRIPNLGSFLVILLVLIMATETMEMVEAITNAGDIQALKQVSNKKILFVCWKLLIRCSRILLLHRANTRT